MFSSEAIAINFLEDYRAAENIRNYLNRYSKYIKALVKADCSAPCQVDTQKRKTIVNKEFLSIVSTKAHHRINANNPIFQQDGVVCVDSAQVMWCHKFMSNIW